MTAKKLSEVFASISTMSKNTEFIPTGFPHLDSELDGGFMKKELIVIGGYTGAGKSFIAGQLMYSAAQSGFKSIYFSLEISDEMVVSRLVGQQANLKPSRIMSGQLNSDETKTTTITEATISVYENNMLFIDDKYYLKEILAEIKSHNADLVIVDFIQNVMEKGDEYEKLSKVALELQKMAKEKDVCILVISQLSNDAHKSGALEYKGSGSIATVCDLGLFIIKDETKLDRLTLAVKKNRRGRSGIWIDLISRYPGGKIEEYEEVSDFT